MSRSSPRSAGGYHHGNLQAALEDAALDLLETTSAAKISLREVARRAGVSHNAPYHHFGDRAALLGALGVRGMAALLAAQEEAVGCGRRHRRPGARAGAGLRAVRRRAPAGLRAGLRPRLLRRRRPERGDGAR